jgi:YidC/Oxa1 family membrane protein insertase
VAENKLTEPFLWIPSLEGPIYDRPTAEAADWLKSIFAGNPLLGWHDTLAFLSLPLILYISQSISQKVYPSLFPYTLLVNNNNPTYNPPHNTT